MASVAFKERVRRFKLGISAMFIWLAARRNTPKSWFSGSYSTIKLVRFSLVILALFDFSAVALGNPIWNSANLVSLWFGLAEAGYVIIAMIYLLGLRMWYAANEVFLIGSAIINFSLGSSAGLNPLGALGSVTLNTILALTWLYLVIVGLIMMRYDKGSKVNELLLQS